MARRWKPPQSEHTILVVDDQEETLIAVRSLLEREGHRVLTAQSGEQALALFKANDVHLLLVDYVMPRMTGAQLVREIRAFDPFVQIILQTGYSGDTPPRVMLTELDIQGYHDKAEGPEKLLVWVDVGLKAHRLISSLRERERLQRELVANVSHEFRTPLNIIGGYVDLLLDGAFGCLPRAALQPLRSVRGVSSDLLDLVVDFLTYARVEFGVAEVAEQAIVTAELAREMQRLGGVLVEGKQVRFAVDVADVPAYFVTDPVKLRTILRNLVANAVKFTTVGTIALEIGGSDGCMSFRVRDTGLGIAREHLGVIFEPFRQLDGSVTRKHGGVGLGLALSRKLAELLGGDIEVQSAPGVGSVFTLILPAHASAESDHPRCRPDETHTPDLPAAASFS